MEQLVRDFMRHGAVTCSEDTPVREVAQIMVVNRTRYVVVVRETNEVVGIISARSMLKAWGKDIDRTPARALVLPYTITVTPQTPLQDAIRLMQSRRIQHLIVLNEKAPHTRVVGILSASDIVIHMARSDSEGAQEASAKAGAK